MKIPKDCYEEKLTPLVVRGKLLGLEGPWPSAAIKTDDFPAYLEESNRAKGACRMTISEMQKEIHRNAVRHGWYDDPRKFGELIALCHSELSEALEEHRNGMKVEEVIEHLNDINTIARIRHMGRLMDGELEDGEIQVYRDRFEAVKMAVSALEKQTQKEPEIIMIGLHNTEIAIYGKMNNIEISTKLQINYRLQKNL